MSVHIIKVKDTDCPICQDMARYDSVVADEFEGTLFKEMELDYIIEKAVLIPQPTGVFPSPNALYRMIEEHCLTSTYQLDLPTYLLLDQKGNYKGKIQGALGISEFRGRVKDILSGEVT
jgi:hypothetical protein